VRHPASADGVAGIVARIERAPGILKVGYALEGDLDGLLIPVSGRVRRGDKLWQHTCFEIFISARMPAYHEFNFSPSGEWAAYAFGRYREAIPHPAVDAPSVSAVKGAGALKLDVVLPLRDDARFSVALSAVVESRSGALSYWALNHPPGKPDFHHPDSLAFELDELRN